MDGRRSSADSIKLSPLSEWRRDNVFVNRKKSEVKPIHRSSTDFDTTLVIGPQMDTMKTSGRSRAASPGEHTRMVQAEQFELNQAIALQQQMNALESQKRMSARQSWPSRHSIKGSNAQLGSEEQLPVPHQLQQQQQQQQEQQHQYYQEQHQQQVQQQCNQQQHQQHQQQQQQQQQQEQQQHNDHKEHHHQQQQKQPVVQQQHLSYQQLPKQQQHQQQQQTRQQYRQQQQQQELQQQPQQHQHQQQWPQRQQKINKTPEAPAWRWQQQQAQENVYQDSFEDLTEEDLFSQCQNHLHVINSCTDLQQYIKDEMKKQATLENMIFHKMTAKAQRLQQKALNLRQSRAIGWVAQALEELSGQVTQQAQAHHVYMITLANQCKAIQHSLNGHHQLMKNVLAHNSPENSAQCASMKWMKSNPQASPRHGEVMTGGETDEDRVARISFLQASHNFEGIRKPRMKLLNKIEYLHSQQRVTIHQLSEVEAAIKDLMSHEENETLIWRIQVEIKDNEIRREFLETRREQIDSDLKFAGLELKDFDYEYRDELLEILNVFRQHRVRYDTTLKKSFDLLRAIILREKGYLKSMVSKDALSAETQTHSDDEDDSEIYSSSMDNWVFKMLSSAKETAQSSETSDYTKVNATMSTGSPDNKSTNPFLNFRAEKDTTPYSRDAFYSFMSLDSTATGSSGNRIKPSNVPPEGSITRRTPSPRTVDDFVGVETFVGATNVNFSRAESSSSSSKPDYSNETDEKDMEASPVENESNVLARSLNEENALSHKSESIESPQEDDDETEKEMIRKYIKESDSSQNNILTKVKLDRMKRLHNLLKSGSQGSSDTLEDDENSFEGNCIFQVEKIEGEMHQKHREEERILHLITKYAGSNKLWKLKRCLSLSKNSNNCEPVPRHIVEAAGALEGEDRLDFDYIQILSPETHGRSVRVCAVRPISSEGENDDTPEEANNNRTSDNVKPTNEETAEGGMAIDLTVYEITAGQFMAPKENGAILEDGCESVERPATNCSNNMQPCFFGNNKKISPQRDEAQKSTSETRVKDVFEYTPAPKEKMNSRQDSSPHTNSENLRNRDDRSDVSDSERKASRCHSVKLENEGVKPFTYRDKQQELFARGQKTSGSGEANSERTNFELEDETENTLPKIIIGQSEIPNAAEVSRDKYSQESDRWGASIGHAKKDESQIGDGWEEETIPKTMYLEVDEAIAVQSLSKTIQCEHETVPKEFDPNPSSKPCELRTTTNLLPNQTWNRPLKSSLRRASWQRPTHIGIQYLEREKWSSEYGFAYQSKAMPSVYPLPYDEDLIEKQQIAANQDLRESQHQDGSKPNRCTKKVRFDHRVQFDDNTEMIDSSSSSDQVRSSSDDVDALNCNNSNDTALATAQNKENNPLYTPGSLRYIICEFLVCDFVRENINQSNNTDNNSQDDTLAQVEAKQDGNVAGQGTGQEQPSTKPVHTWHLLEHRDEQSRQPTFSEEQTDMPQGDMPQADSSQMHPVFVTSFSSRTHSGNSAKFSNIICQRKGIITAQVSNSSNKLLPQVSYDNIWPTTALPCETETRLPSINGDEKHLTATEVSHEYDLTHGKNEHLSFITPFPLKRLELETSGWTNGKPPFKNSPETRSLEGQQRVKNTQAVCAAFYQPCKPSSERSHQNSGNFQRDIGRHEVKNEPNTQRQEKPNDTKKSGKPVVLPILRNQSVGINTPRVARKTSGRTQHDSDVLLPSGCYKDRTPIPFTIKTLELTISSRSARKTTFSNSNSNSLAHQGQCSAHDDLCFRSESAGGNEVDQPASNKSADLSEISAGKQRAPDNHFAPTLSLGKRPWSTNRYLRAKGRSPTVKISEVSEHVVLPRRHRRYLPAGSVRFCSPPSTGHSQHMKRMIQPDLEQEDKRHQTQKQTSVCILDVADAAAECQTPKSHLQETPKKVRIDDGSLHPDEDGTNISVHEMTISSQYATEIQGEKSPKDPSEKRLHTDQLDCPSRSLEPEGMVADSCRQDDDAVNNVCVDTETPKQQRETSGTALYDSEPTTENLWKLRKLSKGFTTADELYASSAAQAQRAIRCYSDPRPPMMIRPVRLKTKLTPFLCGELTKEMCRKSEKITDINLMTVLRSRGVTTPRKVMPLGKSSAYAEAIRGCPSVFSYIKNAGVQEEQKEGLVPVQHDDSIVPIQCDNSTVPAHCDISIVPTLRDDSTVSAERDSSLVSAQHDNFPVSAQCDSSTVLAQCDNSTVSAQLDSSTFPAQHDHSTVSAQRDNSAVSAQHDNSTVPAQHDNSIVPEQRDNSTVSTEHDSSTVSAQRDNSTVSAQCDNSIVLAQCDSSTFSTQRNSCTVSARRDNSTVPAQHDNITKLRIQEKPLTPCDSEKVSNRDTTLICRKGRGFPPANRSKPTFGFPPACRSKHIPHKSVKSVAQKTGRKKSQSVLEQPKVLRSPRKTATEHQRKTANVCENMHEGSNKGSGKSLANGHKRLRMTSKSLPQHCNEPPATDTDTVHKHAKNSMLTEKPCPKRKIMVTNIELPRSDHPKSENKLCQKQKPNVLRSGRASQKSIENLIDPENGAAISCNAPVDERYPSKISSSYSSENAPTFGKDHSLGNMHKKLPLNGKKVTTANSAMTHQRPDIVGLRLAQKDAQAKSTLSRPIENEPLQSRCTLTQETFDRVRRWLDMSVTCRTTPSVPRPANVMQGGPLCTAASKIQPDGKSHMSVAQSSVVRGRDPFRSGQNADGVTPNSLGPSGLEMQPVKSNKHKSTSATTSVSFSNNRNNNVCRRSHDVCNSMQYPTPNSQPHQGKTCLPYADHHVRMSLCGSFNDPHLKIPTYFHRQEDPIPISYTNESKVIVHKSRENQRVCLNTDASINCAREVSERCTRNNLNGGHPTCYRLPADEAQRPKRHEVSSTVCRNKTPAIPNITPKNRYKRTWPSKPKNGVAIIGLQAFGYRRRRKDSDPSRQPQSDSIDQQVEVRPSNTCGDKLSSTPDNCHGPSEPCQLNKQTAAHFESVMPQEESTNTFTVPCEEQRLQGESILSRASKSREGARHARSPWSLFKPQQKVAGPSDETESKQSHMPLPLRVAQSQSRTIETNNLRPDAQSLYHYPQKFPVSDPAAVPHLSQRQEQEPHFREASDAAPDLVPQWFCPQEGSTPKHKTAEYLSLINSWEPSPTAP